MQERSIAPKPSSPDRSSTGRRQIGIWLAFLVAVLLLRGGGAIALFPSMQQDPDAYVAMAEGWATSGTFGRIDSNGPVSPTAYRPPLYPWVLSWMVHDSVLNRQSVAILHLVLGTATCLLTVLIAMRLLHCNTPPLAAITSGLCVAIDPILIRQSSLVMTETLATFFAVAVWWLWLRAIKPAAKPLENGLPGNHLQGSAWTIAAVGAMLGFSCLLRPTSLVWAGLMILMLLCISLWSRKQLYQPVLLGLAVTIVLVPWVVRNHKVLGEPLLTTTHGGYTLLLANNPVLYSHFEQENLSRNWDENRFHRLWDKRRSEDPRLADYWNDSEAEDANRIAKPIPMRTEIEDDRLANETAIATIKRSPVTFVKSCFARFLWFFAVNPGQGQASTLPSIAIGVWYSVTLGLFFLSLVLALSSWWSRKRKSKLSGVGEWIPAIALSLSLVLIHSVYWSNMRMRAPMMPVVYIAVILSLSRYLQTLYPPQPSENSLN